MIITRFKKHHIIDTRHLPLLRTAPQEHYFIEHLQDLTIYHKSGIQGK